MAGDAKGQRLVRIVLHHAVIHTLGEYKITLCVQLFATLIHFFQTRVWRGENDLAALKRFDSGIGIQRYRCIQNSSAVEVRVGRYIGAAAG